MDDLNVSICSRTTVAPTQTPSAVEAKTSSKLLSEVVELRNIVQDQEARLRVQTNMVESLRAELAELQMAWQAQQVDVPCFSGTAGGGTGDLASPQAVTLMADNRAALVHGGMESSVTNPTSSIFYVRINKTPGSGLGLELDEDTLKVTTVDEEGLVADWNSANPHAAIRPGTRIVEVNGQMGVEQILDRLIQDTMLEIALACM